MSFWDKLNENKLDSRLQEFLDYLASVKQSVGGNEIEPIKREHGLEQYRNALEDIQFEIERAITENKNELSQLKS